MALFALVQLDYPFGINGQFLVRIDNDAEKSRISLQSKKKGKKNQCWVICQLPDHCSSRDGCKTLIKECSSIKDGMKNGVLFSCSERLLSLHQNRENLQHVDIQLHQLGHKDLNSKRHKSTVPLIHQNPTGSYSRTGPSIVNIFHRSRPPAGVL